MRVEGTCDYCGKSLIKRKSDHRFHNECGVRFHIEKRIQRRREENTKAKEHYKKLDLTTNKDIHKLIPLCAIYGTRDRTGISAGVRYALNIFLPTMLYKIKHETRGITNKRVASVTLDMVRQVVELKENRLIDSASTADKQTLKRWYGIYRKLEEYV